MCGIWDRLGPAFGRYNYTTYEGRHCAGGKTEQELEEEDRVRSRRWAKEAREEYLREEGKRKEELQRLKQKWSQKEDQWRRERLEREQKQRQRAQQWARQTHESHWEPLKT